MAVSEEFLNLLPNRGKSDDRWEPTGGTLRPITEEDAKCPVINLEKSEEQAMQISFINSFAFTLDEEYLAEAAKQLRRNADSYDAMAVLNRMYTREHSDLLQAQAAAIEHLVNYIRANKRVTELRAAAKQMEEKLSKVNNFKVV